ncbi:MAG: ParB N-terminal domain-containing protein [Clostridiaceae bacterium]|nr:ParB N-terminal domain-containing protein [Clostridiaceae bacterium]
MTNYPVYKELQPIQIPLDLIYLDPNNPRFVSMKWSNIPDEKIDDVIVQKEVENKLKNEFSIDNLVMNMQINGFLPIDRVIVREFTENKYVVLEGNRRICAAKILAQQYLKNPTSVDEEIIESIKEIPCLAYTGTDEEASWIFQGLRHIMGIQEWSAFNKSKLLVTLMEEENLSLTEVGQKFGLTAYGAGQWARGYYAFRQALEKSDYTREIDEKVFPYFQEVFNRSNVSLREWLDWDEAKNEFRNNLNFNEFLSWLYPRDYEQFDESLDSTSIKGDWSQRLISRSNDLRTLSFLIRHSTTEFELFRSEGDIEKAYSMALQKKYEEEAKKISNPSEEVFDSIEKCTKLLDNIPFKMLKEEQVKAKLFNLLERLEKTIQELKES